MKFVLALGLLGPMVAFSCPDLLSQLVSPYQRALIALSHGDIATAEELVRIDSLSSEESSVLGRLIARAQSLRLTAAPTGPSDPQPPLTFTHSPSSNPILLAASLLHIAQQGHSVSPYISQVAIEDEAIRFQIAKLEAENFPDAFLLHVPLFEIHSTQYKLPILIALIRNNRWPIASSFLHVRPASTLPAESITQLVGAQLESDLFWNNINQYLPTLRAWFAVIPTNRVIPLHSKFLERWVRMMGWATDLISQRDAWLGGHLSDLTQREILWQALGQLPDSRLHEIDRRDRFIFQWATAYQLDPDAFVPHTNQILAERGAPAYNHTIAQALFRNLVTRETARRELGTHFAMRIGMEGWRASHLLYPAHNPPWIEGDGSDNALAILDILRQVPLEQLQDGGARNTFLTVWLTHFGLNRVEYAGRINAILVDRLGQAGF